jgi:signal transduction histidine kinase
MSDIVWATSPRKDRLRNLTERMQQFASEMLGNRGIEFHLQVAGLDDEMKLEAEVRRQVFLIFKECVNNIVRHSGSTAVSCEFGIQRGRLVLTVRDNGRGFSAHPGEGHGLNSIRRRAESLGGTVEIAAEGGQGVIPGAAGSIT